MKTIIDKRSIIALFIILITISTASGFGIIVFFSSISYSEMMPWFFLQGIFSFFVIILNAIILYFVSIFFHEIGHIVSVMLLRNKCTVVLRTMKVGIVPYTSSAVTLWHKLAFTIELFSGIAYQTAIIAILAMWSIITNSLSCQILVILQILLYLFFICGYFRKNEDGARIVTIWKK